MRVAEMAPPDPEREEQEVKMKDERMKSFVRVEVVNSNTAPFPLPRTIFVNTVSSLLTLPLPIFITEVSLVVSSIVQQILICVRLTLPPLLILIKYFPLTIVLSILILKLFI